MDIFHIILLCLIAVVCIGERIRIRKLRSSLELDMYNRRIIQLEEQLREARTKIANLTIQQEEFESYTASAFKEIKEEWLVPEPGIYLGLIDPNRTAILEVLKKHYSSKCLYSFVNEKVYKVH